MSKQNFNLLSVEIEARVIALAQAFINTKNATVRSLGAIFSVSKSTVHKDLSERLRYIDLELWDEVDHKLTQNREERHIKGGEATRKKYLGEQTSA